MHKRHHHGRWFLYGLTILLIVYIFYTLFRQLALPHIAVPALPAATAQPLSIRWPDTGQSAVGAVGYGLLASHGPQTSYPVASVAKIVTALAILQQKPLKPGEQGPTITLNEQDVVYYNQYVAIDGSVVPVQVGEQISEYQALQAMLLPSANNMAASAAGWAFGSQDGYLKYAGDYVTRLGMTNTHINDASGFSPQTTSTASDLVRLGLAALANPVLAQIVNQPSAQIPVAGTIHNVNVLLGRYGIVGIKTGNTDAAGGCFLSAARQQIGSHEVITVSAVEGAPSLSDALRSSAQLSSSLVSNFSGAPLIKKDQQIGNVTTVWGANSPIIAASDSTMPRWNGDTIQPSFQRQSKNVYTYNQGIIGSINVQQHENTERIDALTSQSVAKPSYIWRLTHPF